MRCIICGSNSEYYFSKIYSDPPFNALMADIGEIKYFKCNECGFVLSQTHSDLESSKWIKINETVHHYMERNTKNRIVNQPPYSEQAMMLLVLGKNGICDLHSIVDYAAGYGTLSKFAKKYCGINIPIYDPYVRSQNGAEYIPDGELARYNTVINSAMFEHVLNRADLDRVNNLVGSHGVLIIHTYINEVVPADSTWFYLNIPVHTAFHTNKSMGILMKQWGYESSLYCPRSKCWALLKKPIKNIAPTLDQINEELQTEYLFYKDGFMDYWK